MIAKAGKSGLLLACCLLTTTLARAQTVHTVDGSGGGDFTTLPSAIQAAADGDVLILKAGTYDPLVIVGKGLTIQADRGNQVTIRDTLHVEAIGPGQCVSIKGLDIDANDVTYAGTVEDCTGPVLIEDCTFDGSGGALVSGGIFIANCASVTFVRTSSVPTLTAGASLGRAALYVFASSVFAYDCTFTGSDGIPGQASSIPGANGATVFDGFLFAAGCTLTGGRGGDGGAGLFGCTNGGNGGDGLRLIGTGTAAATLIEEVATGGLPGNGGGMGCFGGLSGIPVRDQAGTTTTLAGTARKARHNTPARETQNLNSIYDGVLDEFVVSVFGPDQVNGVPFNNYLGANHTAGGGFFLLRGTVPAGGQLAVSAVVPELGMMVDTLTIVEQPIFFDLVGGFAYVGNPTSIALLDSAF